jgi:hypothetical protein
MRLYRLGEIITYYRRAKTRSKDNLELLNDARITFWQAVLDAELHHERITEAIRTTYVTKRDTLRSTEEKKRQIGLH